MSDEHLLMSRLSKSGKAVLFYDDRGFAFMTSVWAVQELLKGIKGSLRSPNLMINKIGEGNQQVQRILEKGYSSSKDFTRGRVSSTKSAGDSSSARNERSSNVVKVKGDDW